MTHEELKSQIAKLLEGNNDPEKIKQAAAVEANIDLLKKDEDDLMKKNTVLADELKKSILTGSYKPMNTADEKGSAAPSAPKSLEEFTLEYLAKKEIKP